MSSYSSDDSLYDAPKAHGKAGLDNERLESARTQKSSSSGPQSPSLFKHEDEEDGSELGSSESDSPDRPNRYTGPRRTWEHWTATERQTSASLDQTRAGDLSVHLYNAHALKRRLRSQAKINASRPWQNKESWIDDRDEEEWYPYQSWTAWPLEPAEVPRAWERFGDPVDDGEEDWTVKMPTDNMPSVELEELLVGLVLKKAKERLQKEEQEEAVVRDADSDAVAFASVSKNIQEIDGPMSGHEGSPQSASPQSHVESALSDRSGTTSIDRMSQDSAVERQSTETGFTDPVMMADDDKASLLLRPIVRSLLAKIDALLIGLQRSSTNIESGARSIFNLEPKRKKSQRNKETLSDPISISLSRSPSEKRNDGTMRGASSLSKGPGRPRKYPKPLEGESYYKMRKRLRLAEEKSDQSVVTDTAETSSPSVSHGQPRGRPRGRRRPQVSASSDSRSMSDSEARSRRGLRDWSELLATAAVLGWKPAVVQSTANRCALVFGESMKFRIIQKTDGRVSSDELDYRPELIGPFCEVDETLESGPSRSNSDIESYSNVSNPDLAGRASMHHVIAPSSGEEHVFEQQRGRSIGPYAAQVIQSLGNGPAGGEKSHEHRETDWPRKKRKVNAVRSA